MEQLAKFVSEHIDDDTSRLLLARGKWPEIDMDLAVNCIESRRKLKGKVQEWYNETKLIFPLKLSAEQCSSSATGKYKAAEHNDKELLVTVYRQKNRALAVVSNFGESRTVRFKLNSRNLALKLKKAVDMENPAAKDIAFDGSSIVLNIPRHDYRVILFE